jgi:electron transport complex protein RnfG
MKDIVTIVFRLTISCLMAALVMGTTFVFTNKAKVHNEHVKEQQVMLDLLGFSKEKPKPASMTMHELYRYIVTEGDSLSLGYLIPVEENGHHSFNFVIIGLNGSFLSNLPVKISEDKVAESGDRDKAIQTAVGPGKSIRFADQTIIVTDGGKRHAYLLFGKFPGFKTFISVMLAVDPAYTLLGLEIMEHEEDPGLGGEIIQDYFKNQFKGKPYETLKGLDVAKIPLPGDYLKALESTKYGLSAKEVTNIQEQYKDKDIYALTGATISSRSVTNGVKGMVKKFAYRIAILDRTLSEQNIAVPF